jgi:hypothetical protein
MVWLVAWPIVRRHLGGHPTLTLLMIPSADQRSGGGTIPPLQQLSALRLPDTAGIRPR